MASYASVGRHPYHPMLVPFPIGLLVFSLIADIVFRAGWGGPAWVDVAYYSMAGGIDAAPSARVELRPSAREQKTPRRTA